MSSSVTFKILLYSLAALHAMTTEYILDIIDIEWNVTTTNNCDMLWTVSQPARGIFAFSGFWDIKEDINTDKSKVRIDVYYSKNAITYTLTPFRIPPIVYTDCINIIYTQYLNETMSECCENGFDFEDKFVSPLTKRRMICKDCSISTDNFPSHLRPGFYRLTAVCLGELEYALSLTIRLEYE